MIDALLDMHPILSVYMTIFMQPWIAGLLHVVTWALDNYLFRCRWDALCDLTERLFDASLMQHISEPPTPPSHQEYSK